MIDVLQKKMDWLSSQPGMDEPLVRWGLLISAVIVFWAFALVPYLEWRDTQQDLIESKVNKVLKLQALKASSEQWEGSLKKHEGAMQTISASMFQDSSYAGAQAKLLNMVVTLARKHHLVLDSRRLLDEEAGEMLGQKVGVMLRLHGKPLDMMNFIHAAAQTEKLMVLESLYVNLQPRGGEMLVQFEAVGFRLGAQQ